MCENLKVQYYSKLVQPQLKTIWRFLGKLQIQLPYDPAIPFLGKYPDKSIIWKYACTPMFIVTLFTTAKVWKQFKYPLMGEWIKMWYTFTMEYYSIIEKSKIMPFAATWMDLKTVSQEKKDKKDKERQGFFTNWAMREAPLKKRRYIYIYVYIIYITESFCYIAEINATLTYFI